MSVSELRTLRDEGLSNTMIAQRLDISVNTVARYLGPMTSEERRRIMRERNFVDHGTPVRCAADAADRLAASVLPVTDMVYEIKGTRTAYSVDAAKKQYQFHPERKQPYDQGR